MQQPSQPNLDINQTIGVTCDNCQEIYFDQSLIIRKASGLLTGTGSPGYVPIPVFVCRKCGHVNEEFLPKQIKDLD